MTDTVSSDFIRGTAATDARPRGIMDQPPPRTI